MRRVAQEKLRKDDDPKNVSTIGEYARLFGNYGCPKCGALQGDPCRSLAWVIVKPHAARLKLIRSDSRQS